MKISDIISSLNELQEMYGNIEIEIGAGTEEEDPVILLRQVETNRYINWVNPNIDADLVNNKIV